jgi:outer membrane receptor for Fe3+-dicitrate
MVIGTKEHEYWLADIFQYKIKEKSKLDIKKKYVLFDIDLKKALTASNYKTFVDTVENTNYDDVDETQDKDYIITYKRKLGENGKDWIKRIGGLNVLIFLYIRVNKLKRLNIDWKQTEPNLLSTGIYFV